MIIVKAASIFVNDVTRVIKNNIDKITAKPAEMIWILNKLIEASVDKVYIKYALITASNTNKIFFSI